MATRIGPRSPLLTPQPATHSQEPGCQTRRQPRRPARFAELASQQASTRVPTPKEQSSRLHSMAAFHRITKRGRLLRVLKEHYLRDDIPCGVVDCPACGEQLQRSGAVWLSQEPANGTILVIDTNIVLHRAWGRATLARLCAPLA